MHPPDATAAERLETAARAFVRLAADGDAGGDDFVQRARRMRDALAALYAAAAVCADLGDERGPTLLTGDDLPNPPRELPSSGWSPAPLPDDYRITRFPTGDTSHPGEAREVGQRQGSCRIDAISRRAAPSSGERRWSRQAVAG